ncbi:hypothetical protein AG4045_028063 [Apium graveolens]|uniref:Uncharacterized protein n=1 Tax=Apium graveolens TaxID=4045 RepID=A0A6L5BAZ1_APIGR|nr:hypothetical protein AG4045_028063 [Apium graveolens]
MVALTELICWKIVAKAFYETGIGLVIYQKPITSYFYKSRKANKPHICDQNRWNNISWYATKHNYTFLCENLYFHIMVSLCLFTPSFPPLMPSVALEILVFL